MIMKLIAINLLFFITSCNPGQFSNDKKIPNRNNASQNSSSIIQPRVTNEDYTTISSQKELMGVWASDNKEPLTLEINADSLYYTEHFESYKYNFIGDSIFIVYPDFIFSAKIYFHNDTMIMKSEDEESKFYRFKD